MAEFPELGQHCTQCKTLDFLPLICAFCESIFCKEHHSVVAHNCSRYEATKSPAVSLPSILGKCCFCEKSVPDTELVLCDKCSDKYCLSHRHYDSHQCKQNQSTGKSTKVANKPILNSSAPNIKGPKNEGLARKVALMRLKQTASGNGSVPMTERLYFKLNYQKSSQLNELDSKNIFLCREWSIGKCIDWLATHLALFNQNNIDSAPKLVLSIDSTDCEPFPMSTSLKQLETEGVVGSGDDLCLKYI